MKQPQRRSVQRLKAGAIAQVLPIFSGYGMNLVATPYVLAKLGLHDFGVWSIVAAFTQYLGLGDLGVARAANRYVALFNSRDESESERAVIGICGIALVGLISALYLIPLFLYEPLNALLRIDDPNLARCLCYAAVSTLAITLVARTVAAISTGRGRQVPSSVGIAALGVLQVAGGVVGLMPNASLLGFAWGTAIGTAVGLAVLVAIVLVDEGGFVIGPPSRSLAREVLSYGVKSQVLGAADVIWFQSGKIVAGAIVGPSAAGLYELAIRLVKGAQALGAAPSMALTTHLTREFATAGVESLRGEYVRLTQLNAAVAAFPAFMLAATSLSAVPLWLGSGREDVVVLILLLVAGVIVNVSTAVCTASYLALGRSGVVGAIAFIAAVIGVILALACGKLFGTVGIAGAIGLWTIVSNIAAVLFLQRSLKVPPGAYLRAVTGPFAVGAAALVAPVVFNLMMRPTDRSSAWLPFAISLTVFVCVYVAVGSRLRYLPQFKGWRSSPS